MTVVCFRTSIGPNCMDKRLERAKAEQDDCFVDARMEALKKGYDFLAKQWRGLNQRKRADDGGEVCLMPVCMNTLLSVTRQENDLRVLIDKCFCLWGLACKECDDGDEEVEDDDDDDNDDDGPRELRARTEEDRLKNLGVTNSCWECPIPIAFGTVTLPGNIIWIGNVRREEVVTRQVTGDEVLVTRTEHGFVDMAIGLCVGEVADIRRVWIGETMAVNNAIVVGDESEASLNRTLYDLNTQVELIRGSEAQRVFKEMSQNDGFGRVPAYRDLCYVYFRNFPIFTSTNNIPNVRVEVVVERDPTALAYETSSIGPLEPDLMAVDDMSRRTYVSDGTDLLTIDLETLTQVGTIPAVTTIDPDSVVLTKEGNLVFRDDGEVHFVNGQSPNDRWTDGGLIPSGPMSSIRLQDRFFKVINPVIVPNGQFLEVWYARPEFADFQFLTQVDVSFWASLGHGFDTISSFEYLTIEDIATPDHDSAHKAAFGWYKDTGTDERKMAIWTLSNNAKFLAFNENMPVTIESMYLFNRPQGDDIVAHVYDDRAGVSLMFYDGGYLAAWDWKSNLLAWTLNCPTLTGFRNRKRLGVTQEYKYIADGAIQQIDIRTRRHQTMNTLSYYGAPAMHANGVQWYDPAKNYIAYIDTNQEITKLYPSRVVGALATASDILTTALERVGLDTTLIDVSSVSAVSMTGFVINDQASALVVVNELCDFFQLSAMDVGGKITVRPLSSVSSMTVDDTEQIGDRLARDVVEARNIWGAKVRYFDTGRDGAIFTQSIGRDVFEDLPDYVSNIEETEFSAAVFTDADTARRSAERYLLRAIQREDVLTLEVAQKNFAFEPSDFINFEGQSYRIRRIEQSTDFITKIEATTDDLAIYEAVGALEGVEIDNIVDSTQPNYDAPVRNCPVAFDMHYLGENPPSEVIYVGLQNPDSTPPFAATTVGARSPFGTRSDLQTPTGGEAVVGRLITPPLSITNEFTTDTRSAMVVRFDEAVPGGALANALKTVLWEGYDGNVLWVGRELIQYGNFSIGMDGRTVTFTNLLRGRFSTDNYMHTHVAGERVYVYNPTRFMRIAAPTDAVTNISIAGTSYDSRNLFSYKDDIVELRTKIEAPLMPVGLRMRFDPTSTVGARWLLRMCGRVPFGNPFINSDIAGDGELSQITPFGAPFIAVLREQLNLTQFNEEYVAGNWPFLQTGSFEFTPSPTSHIVAISMEQTFEFSLTVSALASISYPFPSDTLYLAVGTYDTNDLGLTNTPKGYFFSGRANYQGLFRSARET